MFLFKKAPYKVKWDKVSSLDISKEILRRSTNQYLNDIKPSNINFKTFKKSKFAVLCNTEEKAKRFLKECDKHHIKMGGLLKSSENSFYHIDAEKTCYYYLGGKIKGLSRESVEWFKILGVEIKEYV